MRRLACTRCFQPVNTNGAFTALLLKADLHIFAKLSLDVKETVFYNQDDIKSLINMNFFNSTDLQ